MKWIVSVATQRLYAYNDAGVLQRVYPVSTAAAGTGQQQGSGQTPLGRHRIRAKIGSGLPLGAVLVARRWTGDVWPQQVQRAFRDAILTRVLWLCGEEPGWNRGGAVDTQRRFIYLHGTAEEWALGQAVSHGCVRLSNRDMLEVFALARSGDRVWIVERWPAREGVLAQYASACNRCADS